MFKVGSFYWWNALKNHAFIYVGQVPNTDPDYYSDSHLALLYFPFDGEYKTYSKKELWSQMTRFHGERELLIWEPDEKL